MLVGFLVPVVYCALRRKDQLRKSAILFGMGILIVILYPIVIAASDASWYIGYPLSQFGLFVVIPLIVLGLMEKWRFQKTVVEVGVSGKKLWTSIAYGLTAAVVMIAVSLLLSSSSEWNTSTSIVLFLSAFNEEFLFRGVLLLYVTRISNLPSAYATSIIAFVLAHGQYLPYDAFILSTIVQAILLAVVVVTTKNIIGSWIGHGLTRIIPSILRAALG